MPPAVRAPASDARRAVLGVTGDMSVDLIGNPAVARGPWGFWLRLVMPPARATGRQDASQRELLRRARLMSIFLLVGFTVTLGLAPEIFLPSFDAAELAVVGTAFVMLVVAALLNRAGYVAGGASLLIASVIAAVAANQLTYPGGLPVTGRTAFDLFVIPILLAGVLLPRNAAIVCWAGVSAFIYLDLLLGPKQQDLIAFIAQQGIYTVAATPIVLLGAVAAVAWVAAGSVRQALREADRTRELERAYAYIADQKQQLEVAIAAIQQVHAQAANGDLTVRAPVTTSALAPLAVSLNLMLDRLSQARGMEVAMGAWSSACNGSNMSSSRSRRRSSATPCPCSTWAGSPRWPSDSSSFARASSALSSTRRSWPSAPQAHSSTTAESCTIGCSPARAHPEKAISTRCARRRCRWSIR